MIKFNNLSKETPYSILKEKYEESLSANQKNIEAISISSYSNELKEVNARYVNLKFINEDKFIFFTNYNSPKSREFSSHSQITALLYWSSTNVQIRLKANIIKTSSNFNNSYFKKRDKNKNALAISSNQSSSIESYANVEKNYHKSLELDNLNQCPEYWGGYSFTPYYFEFWEGHKSRLNVRDVYEIKNKKWIHSILQP